MASSTNRRTSGGLADSQCDPHHVWPIVSLRIGSTSPGHRARIRAVRLDAKRFFNFRSIIAVSLMFWCAGAGCMLVSYARASMIDSADSSASAAGMMVEASSSMDAHACCKARHRSANRTGEQLGSRANSTYAEQSLFTIPAAPTQSGVMNCCPLTSGSIVVASRSQSNDRAPVSLNANSSSLLLTNSDPPPLAVPLRLPNRAHSYLLDCAFLI